MRMLQRYILLDLLRVFALMLSGLTLLLVFVGVFREVSQSQLGAYQAIQILPFVIPSLLPFTIPATLLLTVCVVYGRLAGDNEITVAKAAGINVMSLLWPAFALGGVLSLCSLMLADKAIPWAIHNIQRTISLAMEDIFLDALRTRGQVVDEDHGFAITVQGVDGRKLLRPTFHYNPPGGVPVTVQAQEASLRFDIDRREVVLDLVRGHVDMPGRRRAFLVRDEQSFPLPYDAKPPKPRHLSIRKLRQRIRLLLANMDVTRARRNVDAAFALTLGEFDHLLLPGMNEFEQLKKVRKDDLAKLNAEIYSRFALSTSCFFFAVVGAPFAIMQARRQFLTSFFLCFLPILIFYYPLALLSINLAKAGSIPPSLTWGANLAMLIVAVVIMRRVLRH